MFENIREIKSTHFYIMIEYKNLLYLRLILKKKLLNPKPIDDLTTQLCWAELSQLMQCTSPVQEGKY